jgi:hypothetical protein
VDSGTRQHHATERHQRLFSRGVWRKLRNRAPLCDKLAQNSRQATDDSGESLSSRHTCLRWCRPELSLPRPDGAVLNLPDPWCLKAPG